MKTPIQELIDKLNNVKPTEFCSIETIRGWAESLLEKEKEQITDAHIEGQRVFDEYPHTQWTNDQAELYYNETFNTKEK